jgi:hypothetical protein
LVFSLKLLGAFEQVVELPEEELLFLGPEEAFVCRPAEQRCTRTSAPSAGPGTAVSLQDGRVAWLGASLSLYDPDEDTWTLAASPPLVFETAEAVSGYLVGIEASGQLGIYELSTGRWRKGPQLDSGEMYWSLTALPGGSVLAVSGGHAWRIDPRRATAEPTSPMLGAHYGPHEVVELPSGEWLVAAGSAGPWECIPGTPVQLGLSLYDDGQDRWSTLPSPPTSLLPGLVEQVQPVVQGGSLTLWVTHRDPLSAPSVFTILRWDEEHRSWSRWDEPTGRTRHQPVRASKRVGERMLVWVGDQAQVY